MTEIPEHLLARSKARRQAIGQDDTDAADAPVPSTAVERAAPAGAPAGPAATPALSPAKAPAAVSAAPPAPKRPEVIAAESRKKIPWWAATALVAMPLWAFLFAFTLEPPTVGLSPALSAGEEVYGSGGANCAGCHGVEGGGGTGPAFEAGEVILTFPNYEDHVAWVTLGSDAANPDGTYGDPNRPGGPHSVDDFPNAVMPPYEESLSEEEILEVVRYEREILAEHGCEPELAEATGEACAPGTEAEAAAP